MLTIDKIVVDVYNEYYEDFKINDVCLLIE